MKLYEIKAASFAKLFEQSTDIEKDLEQTAGQIKQASAFGKGDETAGVDGMGPSEFGQAPDLGAGESPLQAEEDPLDPDAPPGSEATDDEEEELLMQKVDNLLISGTKGHSYIKNYNHKENSKIHPYRIMGMEIDELNQLRTMARNKANMETFNGELGVYDNPDVKFFQDLVSYTEKVLEIKKTSTKEYKDKKDGKTAKSEKKADPKTKPGKVRKKVK